jgi:hypothetical protein
MRGPLPLDVVYAELEGEWTAEAGHKVRYVTAAALVNELVKAADDKHLSRTIARYGRVDLLCLDELGRITQADTLRILVRRLLNDPELSTTVVEDLRSQSHDASRSSAPPHTNPGITIPWPSAVTHGRSQRIDHPPVCALCRRATTGNRSLDNVQPISCILVP